VKPLGEPPIATIHAFKAVIDNRRGMPHTELRMEPLARLSLDAMALYSLASNRLTD